MAIPLGTRYRPPNRKLQELRLNAGLSPGDLAYRVGTTAKTIRLIEAGTLPRPRLQFLIADVFGLQPLDLWPLEMQRVAGASPARCTGAR